MKLTKKLFKARGQRMVGLILSAALLVVLLPMIQLVMGFTGPASSPPDGNGVLNELSGNLSVSNVRMVDVASPVDDNDAANKAYVDAQVGGSGSLVTLFGVSTNAPSATQAFRSGDSAPPCLRGYYNGGGSCQGTISTGTAAGSGTMECSSLGTGWTELYAGYGPLNQIFAWYAPGSPNGWPPLNAEGDFESENASPSMAVGLTDSICSTVSFAFVRDTRYTSAQFGDTASYISACTANGDCNTCRVCTK